MKVSKGQSQPEIVAAAFLILYMVLGSPFVYQVFIVTQLKFGYPSVHVAMEPPREPHFRKTRPNSQPGLNVRFDVSGEAFLLAVL